MSPDTVPQTAAAPCRHRRSRKRYWVGEGAAPTSNHEPGEELECLSCGEIFQAPGDQLELLPHGDDPFTEDLKRRNPNWESQLTAVPRPGDVYSQFGLRVVVLRVSDGTVAYCCRPERPTSSRHSKTPVFNLPIAKFMDLARLGEFVLIGEEVLR